MKKLGIIFSLIFCMFAINFNYTFAAENGRVQLGSYVNSNGDIIDKYDNISADYTNRGPTLGKVHETPFLFWVERDGVYYLSYCIGYGRNISTNDVLQDYPGKNLINGSGDVISEERVEQLKYVLKFGYTHTASKYLNDHAEAESYMGEYLKNVDGEAQEKYFGTQILMWATSEGYFTDYDRMIRIIESFCRGLNNSNGNPEKYSKDVYTKAYNAYNAVINENPTQFNKSHEMKWDENRGLFVCEIEEENFKYYIDGVISSNINTSNKDISYTIEENKIIITSSKPIGSASSPVDCTFTRRVGTNNGTAFFGQANSTRGGGEPQPLGGFINSDLPPEEYNFSVYTNVGNLKIIKEDSYGYKLKGAEFLVSGNGLEYTVITDDNGEGNLYNIPVGEYTITEIKSTSSTVNPEEGRVVEVTISANKTETYIRENPYPKGSLKFVKYDAVNRGDTKGDATLEGAVYHLCAAEEIKEGKTTIYRKDEVIKELVTDKNGETETVTNLPVGKYYYKEIKPSEGFNINPDIIYTSIEYEDQYTPIIAEQYNEAPEEPITSNLYITKKLAETDYDPEINLAGAKFKVTLKSDNSQVYYSNVSGEDGVCQVKDIPYGTYIIEEIQTPDEAYTAEPFEVKFEEDGKTYYYTVKDPSKPMKIEVEKVLLDELVGKTDAKVSGAYFTVYTDENATEVYKDKNGNPVIIGPTDNTGYAISGTMRTGTYYLKETTFPEGINPDAKVPGENITFRDKIYVASYDNKDQESGIVTVSINDIVNISNLGRVRVMKYENNPDSTEESPAAGAVLRLTLNSSDGQVYYDATVNQYGYAEFRNEDLAEYDPYTIPYGKYTITEVKEGEDNNHTHFFIQAENVEIVNEKDVEDRIVSDEPITPNIRIVKKDLETQESIPLAGAKFKFWNVENEEWVTQMITPSGKYIDEFETNEEGYFITPYGFQPGTYVIYETQAPEGYYLEDSLRIPEDEKDLGNTEVSGYKVVVDKVATGIADDTTYPEGGYVNGMLVIEIPMYDPPLKVDLYLSKKGEKLTDAISATATYKINDSGEEVSEEKYTPVYEEVGLEGVGYKIYAAENIYKPNGDIRVAIGTEVADITTNEEGLAVAKDLYPGEYKIVEYKTPEGYLKDENIPNVILENKDQYVQNATVKKELSDVRQKLGLTFEKVFEDVKYAQAESSEPKALFGVYTKEIITNYKGEEVIPNNALMDLIWVDENGDVTSQIDLPEGTYYVKELYVSYPYGLSSKITDFTLEYNNNSDQEFVVVEGEEYVNDYPKATLNLMKMSTATLGEVTLTGNVITTENLQEKIENLENLFNAMTQEEIENYIYEHNLLALEGAEYTIYTDEACTKPLYEKDEETGEYKEVVIRIGENGIYTLEDLPINAYWVKETKAPIGHKKSDDVVRLDFSNILNNANVYRILVDDAVTGEIKKTDIFTGEVVPNCVFEIKDENGKVIVRSTTDENGIAGFPIVALEKGKKYTYTEIEAPEIYNLNTEPHEFKASYEIKDNDIIWTGEKLEVDNIRKTREVIVRKLDAETGEPLKGCVFTIAMIDPETGEQKVNAKTGEPIYLVENVETDENGEYIIPEAPMGTYKFLEIKAPEGYELDEDLTGYTFTIDNNSPETIIFEVTNTGDIAVIAIASAAVICVVGIVFVIRRNKIMS